MLLRDWEKFCNSKYCECVTDYGQEYCNVCEDYRCSVCGDIIGDIYDHGREHMCKTCRDKTVAQCTCVDRSGLPITYDEVCLMEECRFAGSHYLGTVWECGCCGKPMFVSHDRDGKMISLHEREKELDREAAFYSLTEGQRQ